MIRRQYEEMRAGGWPVVGRKVRTAGRLAVEALWQATTLSWLVLALFMRFVRPLIHIRVGELSALRIGHYAFEPDNYLSEKAAGLQPHSFDVFYNYGPVCNGYLRDLWSKKLRMWEWTRHLYRASERLPGHAIHMVPQYVGVLADPHAFVTRRPANICLPEADLQKGMEECRARGIPTDANIVVFHVRDDAYLRKEFPGTDWSHHAYRDADARSYLLMAETLAEVGYFVLRFGAVVSAPFTSSHPRVIDYSNSGWRSDFLDLYLVWRSQFMLATTSGPCSIAWLLRRPLVYVNAAPLTGIFASRAGDIFIPKLYKSAADGRYLSFPEIHASGADTYMAGARFRENGLALEENTPEQIRDAALEMHARLCGTWVPEADDEDLQERFQSIFQGSAKVQHCLFTSARAETGRVILRMGARFLREHRHLLT